MSIRCVIVATSLIFALFVSHVNASLLIYPVRVSFDETERNAQVTLTNTSTQTNTYRLSWQEKLATFGGGYLNLDQETEQSVSSMIRFSPRQVTLQPGERQVVKLKLRRPRDLADGEYRSHLLFKALPPSTDDNGANATRTSITLVLSFSIPVTVQQGSYDTQVILNKANMTYKPSDGTRTLTLDLARNGLHSPSGNISAYWTAQGASEVMIAKTAEFNLWTELDETSVSLSSTDASFIPNDGRLRIRYEGIRNFAGNTYLDEIIEVKRNQIVLIE